MECGDKFVAGALGPLKAPGAPSGTAPGASDTADAIEEDKQVVLLEEVGASSLAEDPTGTSQQDRVDGPELKPASEAEAIGATSQDGIARVPSGE